MPKRKIDVRSTVGDILDDFAEWTSIHAVPHIALADTVCIALFWTVVFVVCAALMVYLIYTSIHNFLSYQTTLTPRRVSGEQNFPCVTICNVSPWKLSKAPGTDLEALIEAYNANAVSSTYGFDKPFTMREAMRAHRWTEFMFEVLKEADVNGSANLSFDFQDDLLVTCEFLQNDCNFTNNIKFFYDAYFGKCAILNSNGTWKTTRAGPYYGLRITLKTPSSEYLPWVQDAGVVFYVHGTGETPFEDTFGYLAKVGRVSSVGVKYFERKKLGHPYSTCVNNATDLNDYYGNKYEVEACIRSCLQDAIISSCGCYDPQYNYPSDVSVSSCYKSNDSNTAMDCADEIINENGITNTTEAFSISSCNCPPSCDQSYYQISMSQAVWPARSYTPAQCLNMSESTAFWTTTAECIAWYKNNTVLIEIYYERTSWQSSVETASYTLVNLIADTGGQLGLWLGMSVISIFELVTLGAILIAYYIIKPDPPDLENYDYFDQFDSQLKLQQKSLNKLNSRDSHIPPMIAEAAPVPAVTDLGSIHDYGKESQSADSRRVASNDSKPPMEHAGSSTSLLNSQDKKSQ
ncbi:unnamed protein product [Bursaphelenchus xylophilus]|uniref:(pine wood nematode) hypothetical protein n=1 Tax=Bursaphelenchus xylophilus TaxID=6326 RepID=A0A1I7SCS9_BURXY|nr:unnamed protein product [Bursaphelenchus xylophilus]CAG9093559.1 unnamed protein product [Bursaphelenchus xylophilus]